VPLVRRQGGELPPEQVRHLLSRRFGDRGADPASLLVAADAVLAHHPRDPLVVDPLLGWDAVVELGGGPWRADGVLSWSWMARILSASSASAAERARRAGAAAFQA
jgi:hypothetical protein